MRVYLGGQSRNVLGRKTERKFVKILFLAPVVLVCFRHAKQKVTNVNSFLIFLVDVDPRWIFQCFENSKWSWLQQRWSKDSLSSSSMFKRWKNKNQRFSLPWYPQVKFIHHLLNNANSFIMVPTLNCDW